MLYGKGAGAIGEDLDVGEAEAKEILHRFRMTYAVAVS